MSMEREKQFDGNYFLPDADRASSVSMHLYIRDIVAYMVNGTNEARNEAGIADIESAHEVFEVQHVLDFKEAIGQAKPYAIATGKSPCVVLFGEVISEATRNQIRLAGCRLILASFLTANDRISHSSKKRKLAIITDLQMGQNPSFDKISKVEQLKFFF